VYIRASLLWKCRRKETSKIKTVSEVLRCVTSKWFMYIRRERQKCGLYISHEEGRYILLYKDVREPQATLSCSHSYYFNVTQARATTVYSVAREILHTDEKSLDLNSVVCSSRARCNYYSTSYLPAFSTATEHSGSSCARHRTFSGWRLALLRWW